MPLPIRLETDTSASSKKSKQKDLDEYKKKKATVEFPDGHRQQFNFHELEETYNSLKDQRTKLSAELGEVLKPVTEASTKMSAYVTDHMVDLTPAQIDGLKEKTEDGIPRSCRSMLPMRTSWTAASPATWVRGSPEDDSSLMALRAKKPDDYARAFAAIPNLSC